MKRYVAIIQQDPAVQTVVANNGDRFFVTMIGSGFIFIFWMRLGGGTLWYPLAASVLYGIAMFVFACPG